MIIFIVGPTGIGKTKYSVLLAKKLNAEIISSDSVQIYKKLDIGSAKISKQETLGIKHHMIDICEPDEDFNVYLYREKALKIIQNLKNSKKTPLVVGGTGLYIDSLLYKNYSYFAPKNLEYRKYLQDVLDTKGKEFLYDILIKQDSSYQFKVHQNNTQKIIRQLEILKFQDKQSDKLNNKDLNFSDIKMFVLYRNREELYKNIDNRVDNMIKLGFVDEVINLKSSGLNKNHLSMSSIGYNQILSYLDGEISFSQAIEKIKQKSRNYAKRQYTWFRKYKFAKWIDVENKKDLDCVDEILNCIREKNEDLRDSKNDFA